MNTPISLYRFFQTKEYRNQFFDGLIRFRYIGDYGKIEDFQRKDVYEGKGARGIYKTDIQTLTIDKDTKTVTHNEFNIGDMNVSGISLNTHFICSFSDENIDLVKASQKFGNYGIKIENIEAFLDRLNKNCSFDWKIGKIHLAEVRYDKGLNILMNENNTLPYESVFAQKSKEFSDEHEWRVVLTGGLIRDMSIESKVISINPLNDIASSLDF